MSLFLLACNVDAREPTPTVFAESAPELGVVRWPRGLEQARERSTSSGRPLLVLFDEVPGCSTVLGFGAGALSDALLVEAVETLFEPVLVYNNRSEDVSICTEYGEPRWNNPIVRVQDRRFAGPYTEAGFARFLVESLPAAPRWLTDHTLDLEGNARAHTATYSMACFWSGEAHLSKQDGVLAARTGWQGGKEVVEVTYDPQRVSRSALDDHAGKGSAAVAPRGTLRPTPDDDQYSLRRTVYAKAGLTAGQRTRANAMLASGRDPVGLLSPRQAALAHR